MGAAAAATAAVPGLSGDFETWSAEHPAAEYIPPRRKLSLAAFPVGLRSAQAAPASLLPNLPGEQDNATQPTELLNTERQAPASFTAAAEARTNTAPATSYNPAANSAAAPSTNSATTNHSASTACAAAATATAAAAATNSA